MSFADAAYEHLVHRPLRAGRGRRYPKRPGAALAVGLLLAGTALPISHALTSAQPAFLRRSAGPPLAGIKLPYTQHELIVHYSGSASALIKEIRQHTRITVSIAKRPETTPLEQLLRLPLNLTPPRAARLFAGLPGIGYAVPDYIAHIAGSFYPNDSGRAPGVPHGWEKLQWNFLPRVGINAPAAWANLLAVHRAGARGVVVAVVDTGIAFRNWKRFRRSPDFNLTKFRQPCDLVAGTISGGVCTDPYALDREGHGTFVTGTIAESTNNHLGLTGLAYEATIMPVRVLDSQGNGDSSTIAAGIRYAVQHGAQVINLSIEFSPGTTSRQIPDMTSAINYANSMGVVVVGAAGNDEDTKVDYPAALPNVISVGATTSDRCLAIYSNVGARLDLVAPGGGDDAASVPGSTCYPTRNLPDVYQMTFADSSHPGSFSLPGGWFGTSMATPDVSAAAAMVIASGVLGPNPTPAQVLQRLEATAHPLGDGQPNSDYGYGLIDVGAATQRGGPLTPPATTTTTTTTTTPAPGSAAAVVR